MTLSEEKEQPKVDREPEERRKRNLGSPTGDERRSASDRRTENNVEFVTFFVGKNLLGIAVGLVQEVVPRQQFTPIPLSSKQIKGLINLRGQIVTVMNLRERLGLPESESDDSMNVIINYGGELLSLEVDSVGDVLPCSQSMLLSAPSTLEGSWREICENVLQMKEGLMLGVSIEKIFGFSGQRANLKK